MPNFLVKGIPEAIKKSKAVVVYNCNLVNKKGHTEKFDLDAYVDSINSYIGENRIDFVTFNVQNPPEKLIKKYESQKELLITFNEDQNKKRKHRVVRAHMLSDKKIKYSKADKLARQRAFIRHDSEKLAKILMMVLELGDYESIIKKII